MRTRIQFSPGNKSSGIVRGPVKSARMIFLAPDDKANKPVRKTKKGAADLLCMDDEKGIFSSEQREILLDRAGKIYSTSHTETNPLIMRRDETEAEYVKRINAYIAGLGT